MIVALKIIILVFAFIGFMSTIIFGFALKLWLDSQVGNDPQNEY